MGPHVWLEEELAMFSHRNSPCDLKQSQFQSSLPYRIVAVESKGQTAWKKIGCLYNRDINHLHSHTRPRSVTKYIMSSLPQLGLYSCGLYRHSPSVFLATIWKQFSILPVLNSLSPRNTLKCVSDHSMKIYMLHTSVHSSNTSQHTHTHTHTISYHGHKWTNCCTASQRCFGTSGFALLQGMGGGAPLPIL